MAQRQSRFPPLEWVVERVCWIQLQYQGERHGSELYPKPERASQEDDFRRGIQGVPRGKRVRGR